MLQKATVELLDQALCASLYGSSLTDRMVCAGYLDGKVDSCQVSPGAHRGPNNAPPKEAAEDGPQVSPWVLSTALDVLLCRFLFLCVLFCSSSHEDIVPIDL